MLEREIKSLWTAQGEIRVLTLRSNSFAYLLGSLNIMCHCGLKIEKRNLLGKKEGIKGKMVVRM